MNGLAHIPKLSPLSRMARFLMTSHLQSRYGTTRRWAAILPNISELATGCYRSDDDLVDRI